MSEENVEVARQAIDAWNSGDMDRLRDLYDPNAVMIFDPAGNWPEPGPFFGREAIMRQFYWLRDTFDSDSLDLVDDPVPSGTGWLSTPPGVEPEAVRKSTSIARGSTPCTED